MRLLGLHEAEELLRSHLGQLAEEIGGVVGFHRVEDVGGALIVELLEDVHLLVFGHLFQRVGQAVVGKLLGHFDQAILGEIEEGVGEVGGLELGEARHQLLGRLRFARLLVFAHLRPGGEGRRALREGRSSRLGSPQEQLADVPVPEAAALDGDVLDDGGARSVAQEDATTDELGHDPHLAAALLEAAHVDQAGGDDLARTDRGDTADREEHVTPTGDLHDQPDDPGRVIGTEDDDHVAHLAQPVARGVEDGAAGQAGDEYPLRAHDSSVDRRRGRMEE